MKKRLVPIIACGVLLSTAGVDPAAGVGTKKEPIETVSRRCREGKADKCLEAGNRYRFGQDAPMDAVLAGEHYAKACGGGHEYGCKPLYQVGLGFLRGKDHRGRKAVEDHPKAAELFELSCSGGYGPGCTALGVARRDGDGTRKDPAGATDLFLRGCEKGSARGCRLAGKVFVAADLQRAVKLYEKACRWKDAASCATLGQMHLEAAGVSRSEGKAFAYFLQSCSSSPGKNDAAGCYALARMYDQGSGTGRSRSEAVRLYRMACSQTLPKQGQACFELALAYKNGDGIDADANGANQFFRQSCDLGVESGCIEWHRDDCNRLGQPPSCEWLEKKGLTRR